MLVLCRLTFDPRLGIIAAPSRLHVNNMKTTVDEVLTKESGTRSEVAAPISTSKLPKLTMANRVSGIGVLHLETWGLA